MITARIEIPDELYDRAKRIADEKQISFGEMVRRGLEREATGEAGVMDHDWELPESLTEQLNMGVDHERVRDLLLDDEDERLAAEVTH